MVTRARARGRSSASWRTAPGFYLPLTRVAAARALLRLQHCDRDRVRGLLEAESDAKVREELQLIASR